MITQNITNHMADTDDYDPSPLTESTLIMLKALLERGYSQGDFIRDALHSIALRACLEVDGARNSSWLHKRIYMAVKETWALAEAVMKESPATETTQESWDFAEIEREAASRVGSG